MKVLHVISSIARTGGGPSRSSQGLVAALRGAGVDAWLMTLEKGEEPWLKGVDKFINGEPFASALEKAQPDIVHLHGIWDPRLHACAVQCRAKKIPYVIAPRGMLEPWSLRAKWLKKRIARFLYQDRDLKLAAALHATAESEAAQFRKLGFKNPVIISPNGVNVPKEDGKKIGGENRWTKEGSVPDSGDGRTRRALFVSRMHPKKGVLELVESWARVKPEGWVCELVYTLNGDEEREYEAKVKTKAKELGVENQFVFTGPLNDDKKWEAYAHADLFVLPTYSENFGIVVAEALYAGLPVITTKGTPWSDLLGTSSTNNQQLTTNDLTANGRSGWWIDLPENEVGGRRSEVKQWTALDSALREACGRRGAPALPEMGRNGRKLVEEKYLWSAVCDAMVRGYEHVLKS